MNRITLALLLAGLGLSAQAKAAFAPVKIPALSALPVSLSGAAASPMAASLSSIPLSPMLPSTLLPSPSLPVAFPRRLPGVWNHLPVELPAEAAIPVPAPAHDEHQLGWSGEVAVPVSAHPAPASVRAQLERAAEYVSQEVAYAADELYDGAQAFAVAFK
ncbi:MAG TPA: hypothetical protein VH309_11275 [Elusimicrobiota bacterium]|jgi:hypothetical protein|nr:hypothetical protein [Elusimicrobiota bacterium]